MKTMLRVCAAMIFSIAVIPGGSKFLAQTPRNIAYDQEAPTVAPRLTEHSRKMEQRVYKVADNVYSAVGFGLANSIMVVGRDGIIIIDTMESVDAAKSAYTEFRKITDKPVKAVIYTHNHTDHIIGVKAFVSEEDVASGRVQIIAHESMMNTVISNASVIGPILGLRSAYSFGVMLEQGPQGAVNQGIGPRLVTGQRSFIAPTKTFKDFLDLEIAGVKLHLQYAPSETDDEIVVWMPDSKVLQTAEVIQGETFPNLHTLRGTKYRDPVNWFRTIDMLRDFRPEHMVPSHGRPLSGQARIEELLTSYRDAIQYVHDQTIRQMNKGLTPDEIVDVVSHLPAHLANHPWLGEFYGTVKHSVREIYFGYLGWFEGDPTFLDPLPRLERSRRYVEMMGGREAVVAAAKKAQGSGEHQWAAELLTYVIRVNKDDPEARKLKADSLRQLAYKTENTNWRNWYITSARELDGSLSKQAALMTMGSLGAPEIIRQLPLIKFFESLTVRLDPVKSADAHLIAAFRITDANQGYAVEVRRGVAQVHERIPEKADLTLNLNLATMQRIIARQTTFAAALQAGEVKAEGDVALLARFNSFFDPASTQAPGLTAR
ncbi:MAG: MBL fold metallo-hydrolase [Acidobacteria bacterium]|nr:MBL fold metallo-hydrolase [Acidobacteriota bacterium]